MERPGQTTPASRRSAAVAGSDALPHLGHRLQLGWGEPRDELLTHERQVRSARLLQALATFGGKAGVGASRVVVARAAVEQAIALEPVDEPGQAAARELGMFGEVA